MNLIPYPVVKEHKTTAAIAKGHYPTEPPPTNLFKYLTYFLICFICRQLRVTPMEVPRTKSLGFKNTGIPNHHCTPEWCGGLLAILQFNSKTAKTLKQQEYHFQQ